MSTTVTNGQRRFRGLRVAYFTEWSPFEPTGVLRKMVGQVEAWRELGAEAEMFALAARDDRPPALGFDRVGTAFGALAARSVRALPALRLAYLNKSLSIPEVRRRISSFRPDLIYYRQVGPWYPGLGRVLSLAPTVIEINTDESAENRLKSPFRANFYAALQSRILGKASGFVAVTGELADRWSVHGKPTAVIPNAFWGPAPGPVMPSGNSIPAFAFIGTHFDYSEDWHGVDKIMGLASALPQSPFHVIGMSASDLDGMDVPANVSLHGVLSPAEASRVFNRCDVGLGTMALHRKRMDEACTLKVRDYLMHRMPVILGYREAEQALNAADYILRLPNREDNLAAAVEPVRSFAERWCNRRIEEDLSFMSRRSIESRRLEFLAQVADRS